MKIDTQSALRITIILLSTGLGACGHLAEPMGRDYSSKISKPAVSAKNQGIVQRAHGLLGVPYRYGGASPKQGMDCSGLIYYLHRQQGQTVPRTTARQFRQTKPIRMADLKPGDLVFFRLTHKVSHVGLYVGDGQFIHAPSTGKQVQRSKLDNPFWRRRWVRGGRLN